MYILRWSPVLVTIDTVPCCSYLKEQKVRGEAGRWEAGRGEAGRDVAGRGVAFSEDGDRERSIYEVVNTQFNGFKVIGHYGGQQVRGHHKLSVLLSCDCNYG